MALKGQRNGYIMLAPAKDIRHYTGLEPALFATAKAWGEQLEALGAQKVYWIMLSEVTEHLHIHLYPRWADDTQKGITLFESRDSEPQPDWQPAVLDQLAQWANTHTVCVESTR